MVYRDVFGAGGWLARGAAVLALALACGCETPGVQTSSSELDAQAQARAARVREYLAKVVPGYSAANIQEDLGLGDPKTVLDPDPPRRPTYTVCFFWKDLVILFQASGPANAQQLANLFFAGGVEVYTQREYWRIMAAGAAAKNVDATLQSR